MQFRFAVIKEIRHKNKISRVIDRHFAVCSTWYQVQKIKHIVL